MAPPDSSSWASIKSMPLDAAGRLTLAILIENAYQSGDTATLIAAMRSLGRSAQGRHDLAALRILLFGGSPLNRTTGQIDFSVKTKIGNDTYLWEKAMEGIDTSGAPDLVKPEGSAFSNLTANKLLGWESQTVIRFIGYLERLRLNIRNATLDTKGVAERRWRNTIQELRAAHKLALESPWLQGKYAPDTRRVVEQYLSEVDEED